MVRTGGMRACSGEGFVSFYCSASRRHLLAVTPVAAVTASPTPLSEVSPLTPTPAVSTLLPSPPSQPAGAATAILPPRAIRHSDTWVVLVGDRTQPGNFNLPTGVAVDADGNVYVVDSVNHRVQKLAPSGTPVAQWGRFGSEPGEFVVAMRSERERASEVQRICHNRPVTT